jgi:hypothetical protein
MILGIAFRVHTWIERIIESWTILSKNFNKIKICFQGKLWYIFYIVWWVHNWVNGIGHTLVSLKWDKEKLNF